MRIHRLLSGILLLGLLSNCSSSYTYRAYLGDPRDSLQVSTLRGAQYIRKDMINRYVDAVKFSAIDGTVIENSLGYNSIEIVPGFHDVSVYFYWDMGSQRGLAPALVSYASTREALSRTLRFNSQVGKTYTIRAEPHFDGKDEDITTLTHVDFWVEDQNGTEIVSREAGRFQPEL